MVNSEKSEDLLNIRFFSCERRGEVSGSSTFFFATIGRFFPFVGCISFCGGAAMLEPFQCMSEIFRQSELDSAFYVIPFKVIPQKISPSVSIDIVNFSLRAERRCCRSSSLVY